MESELFGDEKGAFTGADRRRMGYFETAHGGTLFLDDVTAMSTEMQVKFLRVLESRTFRRVGGTEELNADVRIIASSNRDLPEAVAAGKLREDLHYRLVVFPVHLPPLRERRDDVPLLARRFLDLIEQAGIRDLDGEALDALSAHHWPGNVRELRNAMHRAHVLSDGPAITADLVRAVLDGVRSSAPIVLHDAPFVEVHIGESLDQLEREVLEQTLAFVGGNTQRAAEILQVSVKTIYDELERSGLES